MSDKVTLWNIFFHPKRFRDDYFDLLDKLALVEGENVGNSELLTAKDGQIKAQRLDIAALQAEKSELALKLAKAEESILELTRQIIKVRKDLDLKQKESEEFKSEMAKVEEFFDKAIDQRKEFEKQIRDLRQRLRDAKTALRLLSGEDSDNELSVIEMKPPKVVNISDQQTDSDIENPEVKVSTTKTHKDTDWLNPLPDNL